MGEFKNRQEEIPREEQVEDEKREFSREEIEDLLNDLRRVGPEKPVGYLPIDTLVDICKVDPEKIKEELGRRGIKTITLSMEESNIGFHGALYAYDEKALKQLLERNQVILESAGWPTEPELFIRSLKISASPGTELFGLIEEAFGDRASKD